MDSNPSLWMAVNCPREPLAYCDFKNAAFGTLNYDKIREKLIKFWRNFGDVFLQARHTTHKREMGKRQGSQLPSKQDNCVKSNLVTKQKLVLLSSEKCSKLINVI